MFLKIILNYFILLDLNSILTGDLNFFYFIILAHFILFIKFL